MASATVGQDRVEAKPAIKVMPVMALPAPSPYSPPRVANRASYSPLGHTHADHRPRQQKQRQALAGRHDQQAHCYHCAAGRHLRAAAVTGDQATGQRGEQGRHHQAQRQCAIHPLAGPAGVAADRVGHYRHEEERTAPDQDLQDAQGDDAKGPGELRGTGHGKALGHVRGVRAGLFAGQARSHRYRAALDGSGNLWERACPAKGPAQAPYHARHR